MRSRASGEDRHGTASRARRWILYEHPGAWGAHVLDDATLPQHTGAHLRYLGDRVPARVLLLRRAPGVPRLVPQQTVFVGVTAPDGGWFERFDLHHPDELFELDLRPLGREEPCGGEPVTEPFYLVCTNGKHDACCAEHGRPVVDALAPRLGERLWECSHVGGDRFAGNLVCLPGGHFYGHLDPNVAASVVHAHESGEIDLERWRGRSSLTFPAQSAEAFARTQLGLTRESELRFVGSRRTGARTSATFERDDGARVHVTVERTLEDEARTLTCAGRTVQPPRHRLLDLEIT